ncbi:cache domain-containing protein [Candidatus Marinarcus aquaticus]|uniref:histidine kinase n=1 Tax=Candidatus Marinarcus aquaticus TaxID=2044504 RepID=A0A4Q0XSZ9_9BACT|nr:cache domain-containing protein [Candidatus Marinarcus aquaticus]RXJ60496.1 histidine kinase [Candidatus Marinarcus aquaticus]
MIKVKSIYQLIVYSIIFIIVLISFFTFIIITNAFTELQDKIKMIEQNNLTKQKILIKEDITNTIQFIRYYHEKYKGKKSEVIIQNEVLKALDEMKASKNINDYTFIYLFDGTSVYYPAVKERIGENLYEFTDPNGIKVIKELIDISQKKEGGYIKYLWYKPARKKDIKKISYAIAYEPWNWTIGKGVYLDTVEQIVRQTQDQYDEKISNYVLQITSLTILLILYSIFIYKNATILIANEVREIGKYFKESQNEDKPFNHNKILFTEFRTIVNYANDAMTSIKYRTHLLEDLNKSLEEKVNEKTQELTDILEAQKQFLKKAVHEINTPLSIIQTNIDLLRMQNSDNIHIRNIESGSKIINTIYEDLSYMIKKNRVVYTKTHINFSEYLMSRMEFFNDIALSNQLFFVTNIQRDIVIEFNETELQRIIDNNISNAIKYSFKESPIYIKLLQDAQYVEFQIKTHSKTIYDINKIFNNQFYRENQVKGGFGLGLKIVKEICDDNSVIIDVESHDDETKFTYRFKTYENTPS